MYTPFVPLFYKVTTLDPVPRPGRPRNFVTSKGHSHHCFCCSLSDKIPKLISFVTKRIYFAFTYALFFTFITFTFILYIYEQGRVVEIYGPEASGKTTLALHVIAEAQKNGGKLAFLTSDLVWSAYPETNYCPLLEFVSFSWGILLKLLWMVRNVIQPVLGANGWVICVSICC